MDFFKNNYSWLIPLISLIIGGIFVPFFIHWLNKYKNSNINISKIKGNNSVITQIGELKINNKNKNDK